MKNSKNKLLMMLLAGLLVFAGLPQAALAAPINSTTLVAWGYNINGQCNVPAGLTDPTAIAAGQSITTALKADGTVMEWGTSAITAYPVPVGLTDVTAIDTSNWHTVALKEDGTVVSWGPNDCGQNVVPDGLTDVTAIAAGSVHSVALKADGTVVVWGQNCYGECNVPASLTDVTAIAAGAQHTVALKADGTVVAWGLNNLGQCNVPAGLNNVVAVAGGNLHTVALKVDGTVVAWGLNYFGQCNVPAGLTDVTAIAAGDNHNVALKDDGTVVAWGNNSTGQCDVPAGLTNVKAIAAGNDHTVALVNNPTSTDYTVSFDAGGGTPVPDSQIVAEGGVVTEPAAPTKAGLTFAGWYSDAELTNAFDFATPITADTVLYAKWTESSTGVMVQERLIFCNFNIGAVYPGVAMSPSFTITEPYAMTSISDYHWLGNSQPAGTISLVHEDGTVYGPWNAQMDRKIWVVNNKYPGVYEDYRWTLELIPVNDAYPVLKAGTYTVIDSNPDTWAINPSSGYYGFSQVQGYKLSDVLPITLESIAITNPPTKLSYQIGEALDITGLEVTGTYSDGSTKVEAITNDNITGFDSSVAFTDQQLRITIGDVFTSYNVQILPAPLLTSVVTFNTGGGTPVPDSQIVTEGALATAPADPIKAGLTFAGWYTGGDLTTPFDFTTPITADMTLYAKWTAAVSFDAGGGIPIPDSQIVTEGALATAPAAPTKAGLTFAGWYTDAELTNAFDFESPITTDSVLYAKWTAAVSFNANGGTPVPDGQIVAEGTTAIAPAAPTKAGLTFVGWYTNAELTNAFDFTTPITADTTLYAKWTAVVSFNANGGTPVPDSQIVAEGATATEPTAPTKAGFVFAGWYQDGEVTAFDFATPITSDLTLNARWLSPSDLIAQLRAYVIDNIANGRIKHVGNSLLAKLDNIAAKLERGDTVPALNQLEAFINEVMAQKGKNIENATAGQLIQKAQLIRSTLSQE